MTYTLIMTFMIMMLLMMPMRLLKFALNLGHMRANGLVVGEDDDEPEILTTMMTTTTMMMKEPKWPGRTTMNLKC